LKETALSIDAARSAVRDARRVLVTGLDGVSSDAIRAACDLAEELGAAIDPGNPEAASSLGPVLVRAGSLTTAPEELRDRADLVILWFCPPHTLSRSPLEGMVRQSLPDGTVRTVIAVGPDALPCADRHHPAGGEQAVDMSRLLDAMLRGHGVPDGNETAAVLATACHDLAAAVRAATCVALVTDGDDTTNCLAAWAAAMLVRTMAHDRPAFAVPIATVSNGHDADAGAILTWRYGSAGAIARADRLGADFRPAECSAEALVQRSEVDAVLTVGQMPKALEDALHAHSSAIPLLRFDGIARSETAGAVRKRLVLAGGRIHDPANGRDGVVADIWIEDGRIVAAPADPSSFTRIDARGLVVMPGGVDLHSHVAGPKVAAGRQIAPQMARGRRGDCPAAVPTIHATGALYAALGYTTVFDAAIATSAARLAHAELGELPILDKGIFLLAADETATLGALSRNDKAEIRRLLTAAMHGGAGYAVKVANPGGPAFWKRGRRGDHHDLDTPLPGESLTPRILLERLAEAVTDLGLPHPLHVHTANLGLPGNWRTLLETMKSLAGRRAHLAHVQFHSYSGGALDEGTFGSGVDPAVSFFNQHPDLTLDVGQVLFGGTVAMTGDSAAAEHLSHATGVPLVSHDLHLEGGCGVLPIAYKEKNLVHAWQWAIGLEWFLKADDPWRLALSTDHPNGAHFTAYPHLMRLLGDAAFRREALSRIHPKVRSRSPLRDLGREYTLQELCIVTRAAPARIAGLPNKGHLGVGADADITCYRPDRDLAAMFAMPAKVFKAGVLVAEDGEIRTTTIGKTLTAFG
jgi:formylmethanofuran dehydrogenase subunit A